MDFQSTENKARISTYHKSVSDEQSISELNEVLKVFEEEQDLPKEQFPWIFVTGLPRSGTTLLMQCLSTAFDFCYVNNFMARLWDAPVVAARMNKILFGNNRSISDFNSDHGKTETLQDPHEWSYFWIDRLNYERSDGFDRIRNVEKIDWEKLQSNLDEITYVLQKPFLNKALHPVKYVAPFLNMNPNIIFIHVERSFFENCESIKEARTKYYGEPNKWWSIIPDNYRDIRNMPYYEQIPEQLHALHSEMKNDLAKVGDDKLIKVQYNDLCADPHVVLVHIQQKIRSALGDDFGFNLDHIPEKFARKQRTTYDEKMKAYIERKFPEMLS